MTNNRGAMNRSGRAMICAVLFASLTLVDGESLAGGAHFCELDRRSPQAKKCIRRRVFASVPGPHGYCRDGMHRACPAARYGLSAQIPGAGAIPMVICWMVLADAGVL